MDHEAQRARGARARADRVHGITAERRRFRHATGGADGRAVFMQRRYADDASPLARALREAIRAGTF